jgi:uncharacterized protein YggE
MQAGFRTVVAAAAVATLCAVTAALVVVSASRPQVLIGAPAASSATSSSTSDLGILASGLGTVSKRPDIAYLYAGVQSKANTAAAAQSDLAGKANQLIARAKGLGIADSDISTSGYGIYPNYVGQGTVDGYVASEQLMFKWHNVDTVGKTLDALVQEGGATQIGVGFGLADPKVAQAEARKLAVADARSRAQQMADAAGVKLGKVLRISDVGSYYPPIAYDGKAAPATSTTQIPVGNLDVQISVEMDFAIDG